MSADFQGTVISMQENPFPGLYGPDPGELKSVLAAVRRNVQFIFSGVSKQHSALSESDSLVTIRVRPSHGGGPDQASIKQEDGASLLFYYIFDDWISTYALVAKREHAYGGSLDKLVSACIHGSDVLASSKHTTERANAHQTSG